MNQYPPYQGDPRYPHQNWPASNQPSWGNQEWGNTGWDNAGWSIQPGQPQTGAPSTPAESEGQPGQQSGQYGQYAPSSQRPQSSYGPRRDQGQYGPPNHYGQSQEVWGYGAPGAQSQRGAQGPYGQYGTPSQQPAYVPNAAPPSYGYPAPGQQYLDDDYDDAPPRKSRKGIYTILSIFGVVLVIMVICAVLANLPPPNPSNTASIAGTWYGRADVRDGEGTIATEAYMDIKQTGTSITGTGKLCVNRSSKAFEYVNITIDGAMSGNNADINWHTDNLTNGIKGTHELTGSLAKGALSLIYQDGGSNVTFGAKKGTHQEYLAACRQLPAS